MTDLLDHLRAALADRYRIERELGGGGMALVYLAEDLRHHRPIAIKVLRPEIAAAIGPERFLREIEIAARLTHLHIVPVHDSGLAGALPWYAMPYAPGATLRDRLAREGPLPVEDAVRIAADVARALQFAHEQGVVHRDIKPDNILLQDGEAAVADFGIARAVWALGGRRLTETGASLGTPPYMSPEQVLGQEADARSDLYALGCVLFEMLAGQPPFTGPSGESVVHQHVNAPPPDVRQLRPGVPAAVAGVVTRALGKTPADRHATAAAFRAALETALRTGGRGETPEPGPRPSVLPEPQPSPRPSRWPRVAGIVAVVVVVAVVGRWVWNRPRPPAPVEPTRIAILPFSVHGREDLAYLGDGMVTLLTTTLDGVGGLNCVDPTAMLKWMARERPGDADTEVGANAAARFGAGYFVLGDVVEVGNRLRLQVSLYERRSDPRRIARAGAEGHADSLASLVDAIAREVVAAANPAGIEGVVVNTAARTTASIPALRAFLEGEHEFRAGSFRGAMDAFARACEIDSTFAMAWYRQSVVAGVAGAGVTNRALHQRTTLDRALRHLDGLSPRTRGIIQAAAARERGQLGEAERLTRTILDSHPDDVEALTLLGLLLYYEGPIQGRSQIEATPLMERVLRLDPANAFAAVLLVDLYAVGSRWADLDSLHARFTRVVPEGDANLTVRASRALYFGSPEERERALDDLARLGILELELVYHLGDSEELERVRGIARERSLDWLHGCTEIVAGRWSEARGRFGPSGQRGSPRVWNGVILAMLSTPAWLRIPDADRDSVRRWVAGAPVDDRFGPMSTGTGAASDLERPVFSRVASEYLQGLLGAQVGDSADAMSHVRRLDAIARSADGLAVASARDFAASIRATIHHLAGRSRDALAALETAPMTPPQEYPTGLTSRAYERFLRAESLVQLGRGSEALRWYETLSRPGVPGLLYIAPAHLRQAQIHERLGHRDEAIAHYRRFVELWKDCDPALRPEVERARQRLAALEARRS